MSTSTIQSVLDTMNKREAMPLLTDEIRETFPYDHPDWAVVVQAAKTSQLIGSGDGMRAIHQSKISPSMILDRMSKRMVATLVVLIENGADPDGPAPALTVLAHMAGAFGNGDPANLLDANGNSPYWPFTPDYYAHVLLPSFGVKHERMLEIAFKNVVVGDEGRLETCDVIPTPTGDAPVVEPFNVQLNDAMVAPLDAMLSAATGGTITNIEPLFNEVTELRSQLASTTVDLAAARKAASAPVISTAPIEASGDIPKGTPKRVNAQKVFGRKHKLLNFDITVWDWDGPNPHVPAIDPHYVFDVNALSLLLQAWEQGLNAWCSGATGTGKSTLVLQACAHMGYMCRRVNMDADMARYDLIGKVDVRTVEGGGSETYFSDGIIPQAMVLPCVLLLDEADAIRGDINYAMQSMLEGNPMMLTEDGGRLVHPNPHFRIVATANTVGSGDASGMYSAGVKVQSRASINRYSVFIEVGYMPPAQEMKVVKSHVPSISTTLHDTIYQFVKLYRTAFKQGTITTPMSPRNTIVLGKIGTFYEGLGLTPHEAVEIAIASNVLSSADAADVDTIRGIADKVVGGTVDPTEDTDAP